MGVFPPAWYDDAMAKRKLTVEAVVTNRSGEVLLVRTGSRGDWELPGGKVKKHESLPDAAAREVFEECGIRIDVRRLIGVYFIRSEITHDFVFAAVAKTSGRKLQPAPPETVECRFFAPDQLPEQIAPFTVDRINDARSEATPILPVDLKTRDWLG
jgi:8-oxo-dGTP pyrophosphatase MutT (NUDIX family)